ncbi:MAG TPA: TetR/AcrR family transcriptional regulator [Caulobacteraceae bacterium]|nr:TetR/AcrR family transcriptional regulator [Caulobacteraceae bacterium]
MPRTLTQAEIERFRGRLIAVAERLFAENGASSVSMRQIAAALGVSPMTPYRYFKDKDEILAAARTSSFNRFADALEAAHAGPGDAAARGKAVGRAYLRFAFDNPAAYRLMFDLTQPTEDDYPGLVQAANRARATMSAYNRGLMNAGVIAGDPLVVAYVFWSAIHGLVMLQLAGKISPKVDVDAVWRELRRALNVGFRPNRVDA